MDRLSSVDHTRATVALYVLTTIDGIVPTNRFDDDRSTTQRQSLVQLAVRIPLESNSSPHERRTIDGRFPLVDRKARDQDIGSLTHERRSPSPSTPSITLVSQVSRYAPSDT